MHIYEGLLIEQDNGKILAVILLMKGNQPNCDTVMEREFDTPESANIWLDDEMSRLTTGKGVWDI